MVLLILGVIVIIVLLSIWASALGEEVEHYYDSEWIKKQMKCGFKKDKNQKAK